MPREAEAAQSTPQIVVTDAMVESVMVELMAEQVLIVQRFNQPLRNRYMNDLRQHARQALEKALRS